MASRIRLIGLILVLSILLAGGSCWASSRYVPLGSNGYISGVYLDTRTMEENDDYCCCWTRWFFTDLGRRAQARSGSPLWNKVGCVEMKQYYSKKKKAVANMGLVYHDLRNNKVIKRWWGQVPVWKDLKGGSFEEAIYDSLMLHLRR